MLKKMIPLVMAVLLFSGCGKQKQVYQTVFLDVFDTVTTLRGYEPNEQAFQERAEQVYRQTNGVLADASAKVDEAAGQVSQISDHVMSQLDLLREAVNCSKQALADAASGLYSLKPRED